MLGALKRWFGGSTATTTPVLFESPEETQTRRDSIDDALAATRLSAAQRGVLVVSGLATGLSGAVGPAREKVLLVQQQDGYDGVRTTRERGR